MINVWLNQCWYFIWFGGVQALWVPPAKHYANIFPLTHDGVNVCHQIMGTPKSKFPLAHEKMCHNLIKRIFHMVFSFISCIYNI